MKKRYVAPYAELILLETNEKIMNGGMNSSDVDDWGNWDTVGPGYTVYGTPGGGFANNGGGRRSPLG